MTSEEKMSLSNRKSHASSVKLICFYLKAITNLEADLMSLFTSAAMKFKSQICGLTLAPVKNYTVLTLRLHPFILYIFL